MERTCPPVASVVFVFGGVSKMRRGHTLNQAIRTASSPRLPSPEVARFHSSVTPIRILSVLTRSATPT